MYRRCNSHHWLFSSLLSRTERPFQSILCFFLRLAPFLSRVLFFPRDGEKSTELLIGSVNPDGETEVGQPGGNGALTETPKRRSRRSERFVLHGTIITSLSSLNRSFRFFFLINLRHRYNDYNFLTQYTTHVHIQNTCV